MDRHNWEKVQCEVSPILSLDRLNHACFPTRQKTS